MVKKPEEKKEEVEGEEEKKEEKKELPITVLKELPQSPVRSYLDEDGKEIAIETVEEALTQIRRDVKELKRFMTQQ